MNNICKTLLNPTLFRSQMYDKEINFVTMKTRRVWLLRCSILINVFTVLYICHQMNYQQPAHVYQPEQVYQHAIALQTGSDMDLDEALKASHF